MNGRVGFGEPAGDSGGEEDGWMRSEARGSPEAANTLGTASSMVTSDFGRAICKFAASM